MEVEGGAIPHVRERDRKEKEKETTTTTTTERERGGERERERHKHPDKQTNKQTNKQSKKQTQTGSRQTDRQNRTAICHMNEEAPSLAPHPLPKSLPIFALLTPRDAIPALSARHVLPSTLPM
uniref:Uncharacterized protein n=1 Tax=Physcomitrium patens TaxID=3218 RepID=A0A2K1L9Y6_PHYPA|nr:hypothetical protein PHYPA_001261 [Physcomitrium patens]